MLRKRRKSKICAPACIYFTQTRNEDGHKQLATYAECVYGGTRAGPIWSHTSAAVRRALATLSKRCDCGRRFHKHRFTEGHRIVTYSE